MSKVEKIMVPVAFSSHSGDLIRYAATLATPFDAELILVNIINERDIEVAEKIETYGHKIDIDQYILEIKEERTKELDSILAGIDYPAERIRKVIIIGQPADALLKLAVEHNVDMIVMGIRDKTDFFHTLTGSVADRVFRRSPVTIVSFRDEKNAGHLRKRLLD